MPVGHLLSICDNCGREFWNPGMYICRPDSAGTGHGGCGAVMCSDCYRQAAELHSAGPTCFRCGAAGSTLGTVDSYLRARWDAKNTSGAVGL